ncbi:hypothetical protein BCV69DRAFT_292499 [Microstroma glucosiphilum]|uniref:Uncharacterized protein n=1 Tax=Pseudomicrostroma glucosiphilum TaxID=1684307 RepID=A0A316UH16_9BASI|nr:hypothetical protein BCV69DRAFT_292499 [Pseudomicrostroma glucosiphilum]PWN23223.1 hypothetical protein BCV69DRAFT_292499 [Pseudomicrostroma glucosiphilum]
MAPIFSSSKGSTSKSSGNVSKAEDSRVRGQRSTSLGQGDVVTPKPSRPSLAQIGSRMRTSSSSTSQSSRNGSIRVPSEAAGVGAAMTPSSSQSKDSISSNDRSRPRGSRSGGILSSFKGGQNQKARQSSFEVHSVRLERPHSDYFDAQRASADDRGSVSSPFEIVESPDLTTTALPLPLPAQGLAQAPAVGTDSRPREAESSADAYRTDVTVGDEPEASDMTNSTSSASAKVSHPPPVGRTRRSLANAIGRRLNGVGEAAPSSGSRDSEQVRPQESIEIATAPSAADPKQSFALRSMRKVSLGSSATLETDRAALKSQALAVASPSEELATHRAPSPSTQDPSAPTTPAEMPLRRTPGSPTLSPSTSSRNLYSLTGAHSSSISVAKFRNTRVRSESVGNTLDMSNIGVSPSGPGPTSPVLFATSLQNGEGLTPSEQLAALEATAARGGRATPLLRHFEGRADGQRSRIASSGSYFSAEPGRTGDDEPILSPPPVPTKGSARSYRSRQASFDGGALPTIEAIPRPVPPSPPAKNTRRFSERFEQSPSSMGNDMPAPSSARHSMLVRGRAWDAANALSSFGQRAVGSGGIPTRTLLDALARLGGDQEDVDAIQTPRRPWLHDEEVPQQSGGSSAPRTPTLPSTSGWATPLEKAGANEAPASSSASSRGPLSNGRMPRSSTMSSLPSLLPARGESPQHRSIPVSKSPSARSRSSQDGSTGVVPDSVWMTPSITIDSAVYDSLSADHRAYVQERHEVAFLAAQEAFQKTYAEQMKDVLATLPTSITSQPKREGKSGEGKAHLEVPVSSTADIPIDGPTRTEPESNQH